MENEKAQGNNEILKCCAIIMEKDLAVAFNDCISQRKYPDYLKEAKVNPLYKNGDHKTPKIIDQLA